MNQNYCEHCGRPIFHVWQRVPNSSLQNAVDIVVQHQGYGCDTGCCGHRIILRDKTGAELDAEFRFDHSGLIEPREWATEQAYGIMHNRNWPHVELCWEDCEIADE